MPRLAVWAAEGQQLLIERALSASPQSDPLTLVTWGSPTSRGRETLGDALQTTGSNDLRDILRADVDVIWLAAPGTLDADARTLTRSAIVPVATSAPPCAALADLLDEPDGGMPAVFIPLLRAGPAFQAAMTALDSFGEIHCIHVSATAGDHQTSRNALAIDAFDLVTHLLGEPEEVWAAHAGPEPVSPDPMVERTGHLTAAMRFGHDRAASITVSDGGGSWIRRAVILGEGGRLIITDQGVSWTDPSGATMDAPPAEGHATAGELAAWHLQRLAAGKQDPRIALEAAITMEAARLSTLTRQVEDPQHVRSMVGQG